MPGHVTPGYKPITLCEIYKYNTNKKVIYLCVGILGHCPVPSHVNALIENLVFLRTIQGYINSM